MRQPHLMMIVGLALAVTAAMPAQAREHAAVYVDGVPLAVEARIVPETGRSMAPMRALYESQGARVVWDAADQAAYALLRDGRAIRLVPGDRSAYILEADAAPGPGRWGRLTEVRALDTAPMLINGQLFVPVRFAAETLGAEVRFAAADRAIHLHTEAVAGIREEQPPVTSQPPGMTLETRLEVPGERFSVEETTEIPLRFVARNTGTEPITLSLGSGLKADFQVFQEGRMIWNWAHGRAFTLALIFHEIEPGGEMVFTQSWNLRDNEGRQVAPGQYTVRAVLVGEFPDRMLVGDETVISLY
jgi:hypothetical protein